MEAGGPTQGCGGRGGSDPGSPLPSRRNWYLNGNYLVILVSVTVILPLALMRQLGECGRARASEGDVGGMYGRGPPSLTAPHSHFAGYLGYSSGFSLSCMVFFLIAVSRPLLVEGGGGSLCSTCVRRQLPTA